MMRKLLSILALLTAASMVLWFAGCGGDDDDDVVNPPTSATWSISEGQELAGNAVIMVTFDVAVDEATITVTGAAGTTTVDKKVATWTPTGAIPAGAHTATVTASNAGGSLEGATAVNFTAIAPDIVKPTLSGASCDPKDGASGVDPADYPEMIVAAFSEKLASASITGKDPDFKSTEELGPDGTTLEISFLQYTMPNETPFTITIDIADGAGNTNTVEWTFETMAKEQ